MPITRQEVNDDITAKITGKTIAKSITPSEDGANRVLMIDYVDQEVLEKEDVSNKSTSVITDSASSIKYPTVKAVYDWATGLFATITNLALKSNIASPTFTGTVTTPAIIVSSETASTIASFDASKNVKSLATTTYPNLLELSYAKGVTSAIQTQINSKQANLGYTPEDSANKSTSIDTDATSDIKYPSVKAVKDYVDQEIKTKIVKTTITEAQILQLFTTPITILDSTEAGKVKYPTNVYVKRNVGTAYTLSTASFSVINDFNAVMSGNLNPNPLTSNLVGFFQSEINVVQNLSGGERNNLYKLRANTGNPTGGTGDIEVYVTYVEITL